MEKITRKLLNCWSKQCWWWNLSFVTRQRYWKKWSFDSISSGQPDDVSFNKLNVSDGNKWMQKLTNACSDKYSLDLDPKFIFISFVHCVWCVTITSSIDSLLLCVQYKFFILFICYFLICHTNVSYTPSSWFMSILLWLNKEKNLKILGPNESIWNFKYRIFRLLHEDRLHRIDLLSCINLRSSRFGSEFCRHSMHTWLDCRKKANRLQLFDC